MFGRHLICWIQRWRYPSPRPLEPTANKAKRGWYGEQLACHFLAVECGMRIIARNWRPGRGSRGEIDLVCRDGDVLVFVEVRARAEDARLRGALTVNAKKMDVLRQTSRLYLRLMKRPAKHFRFDIVEVTLPLFGTGGKGTIYHARNTRLFGKYEHFNRG